MRPKLLPGLAFLVGLAPFAARIAPCAAAGSGGAKVAVLSPRLKPEGAPELRVRFHDALVQGFEKSGEGVIPAAEVRSRLEASRGLAGCSEPACVGRAAALLGADRIVLSEIEDVGKNYTIRVEVYDATGRALVKAPEEHCEICTQREAERSIARAGEKAAPVVMAARGSAPLAARSSGKVAGLDDDEAPGDHMRLASSAGERTPLDAPTTGEAATRTLAPAPEASGESTRFPYRPVAYAAFGVAAASLAATIAFGVYAGKGEYLNADNSTCTLANPATSCPRQYAHGGNVAGAAVFGALTALSAGTGALLLYLDFQRHKRDASRRVSITFSPTASGFATATRIEF